MLDYAGVGLAVPTADLQDFLDRWWDSTRQGDAFAQAKYDVDGIKHLPIPNPPPPVRPVLGRLTWPVGASRWATFHHLVTQAQLTAIRTAIGSTAAAKPLTFTDGTNSIAPDLWMLPARPVARRGELELFLLTLVDERYFWWLAGDESPDTATYASYADLFDDLFDKVGVSSPTVETVATEYGTPSDRWAVGPKPIPLLLDAAAACVGQRVVRRLDGTVRTVRASTAVSALASEFTLRDKDRISGGKIDATDIGKAVPESVAVVFYGSPPAIDTQSLSTLAIAGYGSEMGVPGRAGQVWADLAATAPSGDRTDLAEVAATDWYTWALANVEATYRGVVPWVLTGAEDSVEWEAVYDGPEPRILTRVLRPPLGGLDDIGANGGPGSGTPLMPGASFPAHVTASTPTTVTFARLQYGGGWATDSTPPATGTAYQLQFEGNAWTPTVGERCLITVGRDGTTYYATPFGAATLSAPGWVTNDASNVQMIKGPKAFHGRTTIDTNAASTYTGNTLLAFEVCSGSGTPVIAYSSANALLGLGGNADPSAGGTGANINGVEVKANVSASVAAPVVVLGGGSSANTYIRIDDSNDNMTIQAKDATDYSGISLSVPSAGSGITISTNDSDITIECPGGKKIIVDPGLSGIATNYVSVRVAADPITAVDAYLFRHQHFYGNVDNYISTVFTGVGGCNARQYLQGGVYAHNNGAGNGGFFGVQRYDSGSGKYVEYVGGDSSAGGQVFKGGLYISGSPTGSPIGSGGSSPGTTITGIFCGDGSAINGRTLTAPAAGFTIADANGSAGNPTFALADDLNGVENIGTTGLAARVAANVWTTRAVTQPAAGITVSNGDGVAGNPTLALANDLAALEGLGSTGIAVRSAADTWVQRQVTSSSGSVGITNPAGVAGDINLEALRDHLSPLVNSVVSVSAADTTLTSTAFGCLHALAASAGTEYFITFPTTTGNAGKLIGFYVDADFTINPVQWRFRRNIALPTIYKLRAGEGVVFLCTGSTWVPLYSDRRYSHGDVGDVKMVAGLQVGPSPPDGWLLCNGQAVSRTTYSVLFDIISTTYGAGDGSTTFNVPDFRGRAAVGLDNMGGSSANRITASWADTNGGTGGAENHTLTTTEMPSHTHSYTMVNANAQIPPAGAGAGPAYTGGFTTDATGGGASHNNVQPSIALNYIIKT